MTCYFIAGKPLQIMVCMILSSNERGSIYITDTFSNATEVGERVRQSGYFNDVVFCKDASFALRTLRVCDGENVFIDSDVGLRAYINLGFFKFKYPKSKINVYEEGVGTYRSNLFPGRLKRTFYKSIGVGTFFGGGVFTDAIHVFEDYRYVSLFPKNANRVCRINFRLQDWIQSNWKKLLSIFCPSFSLPNNEKNKDVVLYMSGWKISESIESYLKPSDFLFFKLHPHIKDNVIDRKFSSFEITLVPNELPAEILILAMLDMYERVTVLHSGTSAMAYLGDLNGLTWVRV